MTTLPLPSLACSIDSTGISQPAYEDVLGSLQAYYQSIYGSDTYLDPDSQDGQWIAIIAAAIHDCNSQTVATFTSFSPSFALGAGLSSVVKINGITRLVATNSTATITVVGQPGTQIISGMVGDNQNLSTQWALPSPTIIPVSGSIDVLAVNPLLGAYTAAAGTLVTILTPTAGWQSASNAAPASPGAPVESDGALRIRQAKSTALPAQTPLDSIISAVANLTGVKQIAAYENDTGATDSNTVPPKSIALVIDGGNPSDIVNAIALKKSPGTGTYGTTSILVVDKQGVPNRINYFVMQTQTVYVSITIQPLQNYTSTIGAYVVEAVTEYINALPIGQKLFFNRLWAPANLSGDAAIAATGFSQPQLDLMSATYNVQMIYLGIVPNPTGQTDVSVPFNSSTIATSNVILSVL